MKELENVANPKPINETFLTMWGWCLKGEIFHVELLFVNTETIYGFWITGNTEYSQYRVRTLDYLETVKDLKWYQLFGLNEEKLQSYCKQMAGKSYFSAMCMMQAGFPFKTNLALKFLRKRW
jgi:hypothetical protein